MSDNDVYQTRSKYYNQNSTNRGTFMNNTKKNSQFSLPLKSYEEQLDSYINNNCNQQIII